MDILTGVGACLTLASGRLPSKTRNIWKILFSIGASRSGLVWGRSGISCPTAFYGDSISPAAETVSMVGSRGPATNL